MVHDGACRATRRDGQRCRSTIVLPSGFCPMHDPARQGEVRAARGRGGRNKARTARLDKLVPATLRPMIGTLLDALDEVHAGDLDPKAAAAMAALAGAITRAYTTGVLEERLQALEAAQGAPDSRGA